MISTQKWLLDNFQTIRRYWNRKQKTKEQKWFQNSTSTSAVSASIVDCDKTLLSTTLLPMSKNVDKIMSTFQNRLHASTRFVGGGHDLLRPLQQQQHQQQQLNCHLEKSYLNRRIQRKVRKIFEVLTKFASKMRKYVQVLKNKILLKNSRSIRQNTVYYLQSKSN